jgi:enterochelin esterase-like enzyme
MRYAPLFLAAALAFAQQTYTLSPDSQRQANVPKGSVTKHTWVNSKIYPGTTRDYWVYVPAQYNAATPAPVMVFQDGAGFIPDDGAWRVPIVFDNLIANKQMPPTIGIFIDPGVLPARGANEQARFNRSFEYDSLGDGYARFLIDEILPEVGKTYRLSADPNDRAIAGSSSGGIAAFVAAWERPDAFRRVLSFIGSYTNLRGGDALIDLVPKVEPKPLRVYLQDGSADLNIYSGSWWMANQALAKSLEYAGYDSTFVAGTEAHNTKHGGAILPDALRWLWREYPKPITASKGAAGAPSMALRRTWTATCISLTRRNPRSSKRRPTAAWRCSRTTLGAPRLSCTAAIISSTQRSRGSAASRRTACPAKVASEVKSVKWFQAWTRWTSRSPAATACI